MERLRQRTDLTEAPDSAEMLARGIARLLAGMGYASIPEFVLRSGRRMDLAALDKRGRLIAVEIKRSVQDLQSDSKWPEYLDYCDEFYFAVPAGFPLDLIPENTGLMVADRFGAEILRPALPPAAPLHASRRRELTVRFALAAANRLTMLTDPQP